MFACMPPVEGVKALIWHMQREQVNSKGEHLEMCLDEGRALLRRKSSATLRDPSSQAIPTPRAVRDAGSPPNLILAFESRKRSRRGSKTRSEPHVKTCIEACKLLMESTSFMNIPRLLRAATCLKSRAS